MAPLTPLSINYTDDLGPVTCGRDDEEHEANKHNPTRFVPTNECLFPVAATVALPLERECVTCGGKGAKPCDYDNCSIPGKHTGFLHPCQHCDKGKRTFVVVEVTGTVIEPGEYVVRLYDDDPIGPYWLDKREV